MDLLLNYIVGRMNGAKYGAPEFYWWVSENLPKADAEPILDAIDSACEANVKRAISDYFTRHQLYPLALHYVAAASWLNDDPEQSNPLTYGTYVTMHSTEHALDTQEDEYEIEATYQADARLTLRRQVLGAYLQALRHGHKPWRGIVIELPRNRFNVECVSLRCLKADRDRVQGAFMAQHEKNRHLPPEEQKEATIRDVHFNVHVTIRTGESCCEGFAVDRVVTLHVKHQHVSAHPREWYIQNEK